MTSDHLFFAFFPSNMTANFILLREKTIYCGLDELFRVDNSDSVDFPDGWNIR
jgi:hypothetical protein